MKLTTDEVIEKIVNALQEMSGNDLADLANSEFGIGVCYEGDSIFEEVDSWGEGK